MSTEPTDVQTDDDPLRQSEQAIDPELHRPVAVPRPRSAVVRTPPPVKFGAIDVGTNSIHLVMAEISPEGDIRILGRDKEMVLLGKDGFARHVLTARAMNDGNPSSAE